MSDKRNIPEINYARILYATDLSESGRHAFPHAASLAGRYSAELVVLHVVEGGAELDRRLLGYVDETLWNEIKTRNLNEARDILVRRKRDNAVIEGCVGQYCQDLESAMHTSEGIKYAIEVAIGDPAEEIARYASDGNFDLVVMASHGHGVLSSVLGSTVRQVMKYSRVPVLVVRVPEGD